MTFMVWVLFILLTIAILIALIWWLTYKVLFFPSREIVWKPTGDYEDLYIETEGESTKCYSAENRPDKPCLNMWYFNRYKGNRIILFFHGNAGNISHRDYVVDICDKFKMNLLLVDYSGYGNSDGIATPKGVCNDAIRAYDFLKTRHDPEEIIVWGESLGGCAAVHVAGHRKCRSLLLLSTFSSLDDVIFHLDAPSWFKKPVGYMVKWVIDPVPSKEWIAKVKCPVAIMHSEDDDLIPYENGRILYKNIKHDMKLFISIKGMHSEPIIEDNQFIELFEFAEIDVDCCTPETIQAIVAKLRKIAAHHGFA